MPVIVLRVNGEQWNVDVPAPTLLVTVLREYLGMTGTHVGCDTSSCGACTVIVDGRSVKSCTVIAGQADGHAITTIEGVGTSETLHPLQSAFRSEHGLQCGFCTPGMIMSGIGLLQENPNPSDADIRDGLAGNICRCTGYENIVRAVKTAARQINGLAPEPARH
jgi:aerobic carbon-monoxide dehydrogenase small subunit